MRINEEAEKIVDRLNESEFALRDRDFYQKSKDAQEWINRSRIEEEKEGKAAYEQFLEEKRMEDIEADFEARKNQIRSPTRVRSNVAISKQLEFLNKVSPKKVRSLGEGTINLVESEDETEYETLCSSIFLAHDYQ